MRSHLIAIVHAQQTEDTLQGAHLLSTRLRNTKRQGVVQPISKQPKPNANTITRMPFPLPTKARSSIAPCPIHMKTPTGAAIADTDVNPAATTATIEIATQTHVANLLALKVTAMANEDGRGAGACTQTPRHALLRPQPRRMRTRRENRAIAAGDARNTMRGMMNVGVELAGIDELVSETSEREKNQLH